MSNDPGPTRSKSDQPGGASTVSREAAPGAQAGSRVPQRIGPYKILEVLGEGGMGVVYLAEQTEPIRRRVALKLIKLGMDTKQVIARFETERQALALMNHPNVAKVLDAGATEKGRPYFVMEFVKGESITAYCDRHRLTTKERLDVFIQVCHAVQHAHQKGIIHRDIKPSNVLVTVEGDKAIPKVIDFGVAKATEQKLTERTLFTEQGQLIGTPEYMSPEQAEMTALDIDTRTDIYSLGVILYELLVGALPFDPTSLRRAAFAEIQRIIREEEPPRPSTRLSSLGDDSTSAAQKRHTDRASLARQLRGDLDWIVMKAIEKDRTRRYATAAEFADDIARHLNHEPVMAFPPSASYRLSKFVRKRRVPIAFVTLLLMLGTTLGYAIYIRDQLQGAQNAFADAEEPALPLLREAQFGAGLKSGRYSDQDNITDKAIADCTKAIELDPQLADAYALRAKLITLQDKNAPAQRDLDRALMLDSENSLALRTKGLLHLGRGEFESALEAYNGGMRGGEGLPEDFHNRGRLRRIFGKYKLALADHDRAVDLAPEEPKVYLWRGITRRFAGDVQGAIKDLSSLTSLDPRWAVQANQWMWEMLMLRDGPGDREAAEKALAAAQEAARDDLETKMIELCRGRLAAADVLPYATNDTLRCVTFYYLGARALVEGRHGDAKTNFEKCRDTVLQKLQQFDLPEFDLAKWHLQQLGED